MEEDIVKLEAEVSELLVEREKTEPQLPTNMEKMNAYVHYFLAHLEELLLHHSNPVLQAKYFGVIFNNAPTYDDLVFGTPDCTKITGVNKVFVPKTYDSRLMAGAEGFEPPNASTKNWCLTTWPRPIE